MKYLIGLGVVAMSIAGYFLLAPSPAVVTVQSAPVSQAPAEPSSEDLVALKRESLPMALTDTVTLNDTVFFPRMRIMEYAYVSNAPDVENLQSFVEGRAESICLEARDLFGADVTLRNSFEDSGGNLLRRIYLLSEDCQRFY